MCARPEGEDALLVALNLGEDPSVLFLPEDWRNSHILLSPHMDRTNEPISGDCALRPDEGVVLEKKIAICWQGAKTVIYATRPSSS